MSKSKTKSLVLNKNNELQLSTKMNAEQLTQRLFDIAEGALVAEYQPELVQSSMLAVGMGLKVIAMQREEERQQRAEELKRKKPRAD